MQKSNKKETKKKKQKLVARPHCLKLVFYFEEKRVLNNSLHFKI